MKRRNRNPKPAQGVCAHCSRFFVYFKITKTRLYCTAACRIKAGNLHFNWLESAARRERAA